MDMHIMGEVCGRTPVGVEVHYCSRHPFAFQFIFEGQRESWMISRELLIWAFNHPGCLMGHGVVRTMVHHDWFTLNLDGTPIVFRLRDIKAVLMASNVVVRVGDESRYIDVDATIAAILG